MNFKFQISNFKLLMAVALLAFGSGPAARGQWQAAFDGAKMDKPTTGTPVTNGVKQWDGTKWIFAAVSGSYVAPTGSGFPHITGGTQDGAARAVDLSGGDVANTLPNSKLANMANHTAKGRDTAGAGAPEDLAASTILDWIGSTRGSTLYRGASGWAVLAPGASGTVLTSNGAGADPSYQAAGAGSQTPWAADINGAGFSLYNANLGLGTTNKSPIEVRTVPLTGTTPSLSFTNGPDYSLTLSADITISLADTSGITNRAINFNLNADGTHLVNFPVQVVALTATNQPFASGLVTLTFWIAGGQTNLSVSPTPSTGTGKPVNQTSPTLVTPVLGAATATTVNGTTIPSSATLQTMNSGEINALTSKGTPVGADILPIEDSAASNAKKKITLASIANPTITTLTDGATITWTVNTAQPNQYATVTLGGNRTLAFSGVALSMNGTLIVKQDGTGSRTLTLPGGSKVVSGGSGAITLTTTANGVDILTWFTPDGGTTYYWNYGKNYN